MDESEILCGERAEKGKKWSGKLDRFPRWLSCVDDCDDRARLEKLKKSRELVDQLGSARKQELKSTRSGQGVEERERERGKKKPLRCERDQVAHHEKTTFSCLGRSTPEHPPISV